MFSLASSYIADLCRPVTIVGSMTETPIRYSWRPRSLFLCHALRHPCTCCGGSQGLSVHIRAWETVSTFKTVLKISTPSTKSKLSRHAAPL